MEVRIVVMPRSQPNRVFHQESHVTLVSTKSRNIVFEDGLGVKGDTLVRCSFLPS